MVQKLTRLNQLKAHQKFKQIVGVASKYAEHFICYGWKFGDNQLIESKSLNFHNLRRFLTRLDPNTPVFEIAPADWYINVLLGYGSLTESIYLNGYIITTGVYNDPSSGKLLNSIEVQGPCIKARMMLVNAWLKIPSVGCTVLKGDVSWEEGFRLKTKHGATKYHVSFADKEKIIWYEYRQY